MSKILGQFLISGQFQDICEISGISGKFQDNWEPYYFYATRLNLESQNLTNQSQNIVHYTMRG